MNPNPGRAITLATYDGTPIPNQIDADPAERLIKLVTESLRMQMMMTSKRVGPPTGRYNCHGLVFANRRTNIPPGNSPDSVNIDNLLQRDEYEKVYEPEVGDVIVYRDVKNEIQHTGIVVSVTAISEGSTKLQPLVWSKWGAMGEYEHRAPVSPYQDCRYEFWRLKRLR